MIGRIVTAVVVAALMTMASPAAARPADALRAATNFLCHKRVALLGENGTHGSGPTMTFKAALVQRLIERCGYRAVLFEASRYEFVALDRRIAAGTMDAVALNAAVGGLWGRYAEFAPLARFLTERARAAQVSLGGLDDAVGVRGADYSNGPMIDELVRPLDPAFAAKCADAYKRRVQWDYTSSDYGAVQRDLLRTCVATMAKSPIVRDDQRPLIAALDRMLARDLMPDADQFSGRERSMYAAFAEMVDSLPRNTKVIVWGATAHLAHEAGSWPPLHGDANLGALISRRYGRGAGAIGFSALGGGWRRTPSRPETAWSTAPAASLEARAMQGSSEVAYVDRAMLKRWSGSPARMWNDDFVTAPWGRVIDGLIVFRTDRGPTLVK